MGFNSAFKGLSSILLLSVICVHISQVFSLSIYIYVYIYGVFRNSLIDTRRPDAMMSLKDNKIACYIHINRNRLYRDTYIYVCVCLCIYMYIYIDTCSFSPYRSVNTLLLIIQTSQLMLYREIIAVCSQIHTKHINTVCVGRTYNC